MDKFKGLMTSLSPEYSTPKWLFDELDREFHFTLDVCAKENNAKCRKYYTHDSLEEGISWAGICWMNPPYGREIEKWVRKAAVCGSMVVCLLPSRTDTKWWHDYVMKADEIRYIKGRLHFNDSKCGAPFPSVIVVFKGNHKK